MFHKVFQVGTRKLKSCPFGCYLGSMEVLALVVVGCAG